MADLGLQTSCSAEMDVVIRKSSAQSGLCKGEKEFTMKRQIIVQEALKSHTIPVPDVKNIPRVALLGSGGGQRAHISFLGTIRQLKKENLLDCFHYVAGVSGSTWSMSSLYQNPTWSLVAEKATEEALTSMTEGTGPTDDELKEWLKGRKKDGNYCSSDVLGAWICWMKGVSLETRHLTANRDQHGANPYPLYSTVEQQLKKFKKTKEMWFEFSPHESGFLQHGAYVDTSLLNKDFDGGYVKPSNKNPVDMVQLQGMCGCAMADSFKLISPDTELSCIELERLKVLLGDHYQKFSPSLKGVDDESWINMTDQDKQKYVKNLCEEFAASAGEWGQGPLDLPKSNVISDDEYYDLGWGTMPNILYQFQDPDIPVDMTLNEKMHLIDAGLYLNSPYPSVLRDARDIDLIISFDFSEGDPYETLKVASEYAAATGHPFPKVNFTKLDPERPRSYYVFEEKGKPTVIHIPLFNMDNCTNPETIKKEMEKYKTFQLPYSDKAKIDHLAHLAGDNVSMNREKILKEIGKAVQRRSGV